MRKGDVPLQRLCGAVALLAAPMVAVLLVLVLLGHLAVLAALVGALVLIASLAIVVYRHLQGLALVGRQIEDLAEGRTPAASPPLGTATELSSALAALNHK
jgi:hypothetical protein